MAMTRFSFMTSHMSSGPTAAIAAVAVATGGDAAFCAVSASSAAAPPSFGGVVGVRGDRGVVEPVGELLHWRSHTDGDPRSHLTSSTIHVARSATLSTTFSEIDTTSS
jgi:hypothetical protein